VKLKNVDLNSCNTSEIILRILQENGDLNEKITKETLFSDVCYSFLDFVNIVFNCEKEFNVIINDRGFDEYSFKTVEEFVYWINKHVLL
jgi:acyl carrier protein